MEEGVKCTTNHELEGSRCVDPASRKEGWRRGGRVGGGRREMAMLSNEKSKEKCARHLDHHLQVIYHCFSGLPLPLLPARLSTSDH